MKVLTAKKVAKHLPTLPYDANKYTRGVCELVVGTSRFPGAGVLAAMAASRMGAGYVNVYTCPETAAALHVAQPSAVTLEGAVYKRDFHAQGEGHPRASVVGCGMAHIPEDVQRTLDVLQYTAGPVLVDGGALSVFAEPAAQECMRNRFVEGYPTIVTPHGGEAERLLRTVRNRLGAMIGEEDTVLDVDFDELTPQEKAVLLARAFGVICVLKGPDTYIADGNEETPDDVWVMRQGTLALSKAGTGDVLAGVIGALLAQGVAPKAACALGTFVHARAGVLASGKLGEFCVTTEDVLAFLPAAVRAIDESR